jgi:hypothetical protein
MSDDLANLSFEEAMRELESIVRDLEPARHKPAHVSSDPIGSFRARVPIPEEKSIRPASMLVS